MRREFESKVQKVRQFLAANAFDGILLSRRDSFAWLTGGKNAVYHATELGACELFITKDKQSILFSEVEKYRLVDEEIGGLDLEPISFDWYADKGRSIKNALSSGKIAGDCAAWGFPNVFELFSKLRYTLLPEEVQRLKALCADVALAVDETCRTAAVDDSEFVVAATLTSKLLRRGIYAPVCMVAADERIKKYRHPIPTERVIKKYALVVVGAQRHGLFASMSRMISFGEPSEEIKTKHAACMDIDAKMIAKTQIDTKVSDILRCGIDAYAQNGYANEWKYHHQGGATGYLPREYIATPTDIQTVLPNQAFSWNPTIAGTKCEDTVISSENGPEILTAIKGWPMRGNRPDILVR